MSSEELLKLRKRILEAEEQRISGEAALSVSEARNALMKRIEQHMTPITAEFQ